MGFTLTKKVLKKEIESILRSKGIDDLKIGRPFASDLCLYLAILDVIKDSRNINELNLFKKISVNTFDEFITFAFGYHGADHDEAVASIYTMFNAPLLFRDIDKLHKEYLKSFPHEKIKSTFLLHKYIPNIIRGTKYYVEELDDVERITLFNAMLRRISKGELKHLYINDALSLHEVRVKIPTVAETYIKSGIPEGFDNISDMFGLSKEKFNIEKVFFKFLMEVPYEDSHYRPSIIKDKCNNILLNKEDK